MIKINRKSCLGGSWTSSATSWEAPIQGNTENNSVVTVKFPLLEGIYCKNHPILIAEMVDE